jgi:hypothetical protein
MQHYPKNTIRILKFCSVCNKKTMHRVDDGRVGVCTEPHVKGMSKKQKQRDKRQNKSGDLFL